MGQYCGCCDEREIKAAKSDIEPSRILRSKKQAKQTSQKNNKNMRNSNASTNVSELIDYAIVTD